MVKYVPKDVHEKLGWYVYRLIDPRDGQTFYIGKGQGNRIHDHLSGALKSDSAMADVDLKSSIIQTIGNSGLDVIHVVHRHGLPDEETAYEVEAALMDAFPGLSNKMRGHGSLERGCRHIEQLITAYRATPLEVKEPLILIHIGRSLAEKRDIYEAVRGFWRMSIREAETRKLILADDGVLVVGAFRPKTWLPATVENFPLLVADIPDRIGFVGDPAEDVWKEYVGKRVLPRKRGAMTPFQYLSPDFGN